MTENIRQEIFHELPFKFIAAMLLHVTLYKISIHYNYVAASFLLQETCNKVH